MILTVILGAFIEKYRTERGMNQYQIAAGGSASPCYATAAARSRHPWHFVVLELRRQDVDAGVHCDFDVSPIAPRVRRQRECPYVL